MSRPIPRRNPAGSWRVSLAVAATIAGACATPAVTDAPGAASVAWTQAAVDLPASVTDAPSAAPGLTCRTCHPASADLLFGVSRWGTGLIAVGVQQPPPIAIAFSAEDGSHWAPLPGFSPSPGTTATAVASIGDRAVIVGSDASGAVGWASGASGSWTQTAHSPELAGPAAATAMTSITTLDDGFVAGGYADDPENVRASAAVWRSRDGLTWKREQACSSFDGGRIWGVAARNATVVAVGSAQDPVYGPAGAWSWTDASGWRSATIDEPAGLMRAVIATGEGFLAVGYDHDGLRARVWTSRDGQAWTAVPDQPAFQNGTSPIRMLSVAANGHGFVAGGWRADAANGSATAWTSSDGRHWTQAEPIPLFSGGEMSAVALIEQGAVAVGRGGYPDNNQATVWLGKRP